LHIDPMDNHYVPNLTMGPDIVKWIKKRSAIPCDVHLMTEKPETLIAPFKEAGTEYISVHYEACIHLHRTIEVIKNMNIKAGVAINPSTPISVLGEILPYLDFVLIMSVNPGFPKQSFITSSIQKIQALRLMLKKRDLSCAIEVDGGIKSDNIKDVVAAGAQWIVSGSGIFSEPDPAEKVRGMKKILLETEAHALKEEEL
ncbi:MAG: ribulose-phosphate 3-epimerase, partial [Candidatus Fischerbacteria bacterium RBG_13_37_8]